MPSVISREKKVTEPKVKKFKPFKITLNFDNREDADNFASVISDEYLTIAREVVAKAYR